MAEGSCKKNGKLKFTKDPECFVMALGRFLEEAPLGLVEPFSPLGHCFFSVSGNFFLLHENSPDYCIIELDGSDD
jgi:hypothetical protein